MSSSPAKKSIASVIKALNAHEAVRSMEKQFLSGPILQHTESAISFHVHHNGAPLSASELAALRNVLHPLLRSHFKDGFSHSGLMLTHLPKHAGNEKRYAEHKNVVHAMFYRIP